MTTPPSRPRPWRRAAARWTRLCLPPIITAVVGAGATYFFVPSHNAVADSKPTAPAAVKPTGKITNLDGGPVSQHLALTGWIKNKPAGYGLRVFIENPSNNGFYPAYSPCVIESDGISWHCPPVRPGDGSPGQQTRILHVVLVTADGAEAIARYRENKSAGDKGLAMSSLTDGAIDLASQKVVTSG